MKFKSFIRIALFSGLLIAVFVFFGVLPRIRNQQELQAAAETERSREPVVNAVSLSQGSDTTGLTLPGQVQPYRETPLYARAQGFVKRRYVELGASVRQGQLLATLDVPEIEQDIARAQADLQLAESNLSRVSSVTLPGAIARQDVDSRQAAVSVGQANLRRLETLRALQTIRAPFSGIITARNVEVGDLITPSSQRPLFTLAQLDTLRVFVDVPQTYYQMVRAGQAATVRIPELKGQVLLGRVVRTSGSLRSDSRTLLTEVAIPNRQRALPSGLYAQVSFALLGAKSPVLLPANALRITTKGAEVVVVEPNQRIRFQAVTLGRDYGTAIEITSGLTGSERVVTNPNDRLKDGQKVRLRQSKGLDKTVASR